MSSAEWTAFLNALEAVAGPTATPPRFRDFVRVHVAAMTTAQGMVWVVHTMPNMGMVGRNFLTWHRWFVVLLERRLQQVDPAVSIPYWDWIADPQIPAALDGSAFRAKWGITRRWDPQFMPSRADLTPMNNANTFAGFQRRLEALHGSVHIAVGDDTGTMGGPSSPADPIFWLHHANVDRLWALWQASPSGANPPATTTRLQPATGFPVKFGTRIADVLSIASLGYSYQ
jgi:tyrosinase